jgi:hypothetical protein
LHELWDTGSLETEKGSANATTARLDREFSGFDERQTVTLAFEMQRRNLAPFFL